MQLTQHEKSQGTFCAKCKICYSIEIAALMTNYNRTGLQAQLNKLSRTK